MSTDKALGSSLVLIIHDIATIILISFLVILNCSCGIELEIRLHDQPDGTNLGICILPVARIFFAARQTSLRMLLATLIGRIDRAEMSIDSGALSVMLLGCLAHDLCLLSAWA